MSRIIHPEKITTRGVGGFPCSQVWENTRNGWECAVKTVVMAEGESYKLHALKIVATKTLDRIRYASHISVNGRRNG